MGVCVCVQESPEVSLPISEDIHRIVQRVASRSTGPEDEIPHSASYAPPCTRMHFTSACFYI